MYGQKFNIQIVDLYSNNGQPNGYKGSPSIFPRYWNRRAMQVGFEIEDRKLKSSREKGEITNYELRIT